LFLEMVLVTSHESLAIVITSLMRASSLLSDLWHLISLLPTRRNRGSMNDW
jgi:hypothetical protein